MNESVRFPLPCMYSPYYHSPRSGSCAFDHDVIPFSERDHCFHEQEYKYKPYCIFFHPKGQGEEVWQENKTRVAKICYFAERGEIFSRSVCKFYHPNTRHTSNFHWEQPSKPPLMETREVFKTKNTTTLPQRVPVIVKNIVKQVIPDLSQRLKGLALDY